MVFAALACFLYDLLTDLSYSHVGTEAKGLGLVNANDINLQVYTAER